MSDWLIFIGLVIALATVFFMYMDLRREILAAKVSLEAIDAELALYARLIGSTMAKQWEQEEAAEEAKTR